MREGACDFLVKPLDLHDLRRVIERVFQYYRLRVMEIVVPPLRDRMEDLPTLAEHLVRRTSEALHHTAPVISREALDSLQQHRWPGNARELENCLTRAVVLATGDVIRPEHLALGPTHNDSPAHLPSLEDLERDHVERVLTTTGGHKARAAQILGVSRPRLNRLMEKYGLE